MEIRINNKQNIYPPALNYQKLQNNRCFWNNSINNDIFIKNKTSFTGLNPEEILKPFTKFGIAEYKKLHPEQIKALRESLSEKLIKDRDAVILLSDDVNQNLKKMYPNGYTFISIGRSPAVIGKALEYQGIDVKYCPISELSSSMFNAKDMILKFKQEKVIKYKNYLDSIGLSSEEIKKSKKSYIFVDYTKSGDSLKIFKVLLERPEIGISSNNVQYKSLNKEIFTNGNYKNIIKKNLIKQNFKHNKYPHYPKLAYLILDKVQDVIELRYSEPCKQMQFALIDYFAQKGLLKNLEG